MYSFGDAGDPTQGFTHVQHVLYQWSTSPALCVLTENLHIAHTLNKCTFYFCLLIWLSVSEDKLYKNIVISSELVILPKYMSIKYMKKWFMIYTFNFYKLQNPLTEHQALTNYSYLLSW
jgi:hypothetical protein